MNNISEIIIVGLLLILLTTLGILAGYNIRGMANTMECAKDRIVVIHAK